ncbi:oxidoreductase [Paecilomyces variotii No. 5]|uniref:Oxidoreductase n=1 Tax=Byssochlamys spectabilis (strain No. 5 / NBRC 109023) TaxID=1356009 RepID=V5F7U8_BYSSN|nr:oxidoreductase [Paecilomyces variotii No. 5]
MRPIRVGLIGLTGSSSTGTSWAANAHLPYLKKSPHYEIVALLNSTIDAARAAIRNYDLPTETKAYGNPEELASDPDVDLVVCSVRVDKHYLTVRPSIIAGKAVFVEWPLDRNVKIATEMAQLAATHYARTIVGLQGSFSPVARKMKQLIENGSIGRVLSSHLLGGLGNSGASESSKVSYFLDREIGGNVVSIHLGHILEVFAAVLGEFKSFNSLMTISRPTKDIIDRNAGNKIVEANVPTTVPDQISVQGAVSPSGALATINLYGGKEIPGTPQLDWRIQGETGWLRVTSSNSSINVGSPDLKLEVFNGETGEVVALDRDQWNELPLAARNTARLYEAYRKNEWYPSFEWAVKRHETIEEMWKRQITPASTYVLEDQDSTVSDLQRRVMVLENLLAERTQQPLQQSPYDTFSLRSDSGPTECWPNQAGLRKIHFMKDFLHGKNSNTSFHGRSHWYPIFGQFDDVISTLETCKKTKDVGAAREYRSMKMFLKQSGDRNWCGEQHQSMILHGYIPPRDVADQLVNFYLETFEYTYRILHVPTFRKLYDEFWVTPARENLHLMAQIHSILAISASYYFQTENVPSNIMPLKEQIPLWLHCVQHWLDHAIEDKRNTFHALQVQCLLTIARQVSSADSNMVWISCGGMVRTAISAGLHRNPLSFRNMTPFHAELRRRLWATIMELDLQASLDAGKCPTLTCRDYDCDTPSNLDDDEITDPDGVSSLKSPTRFTRTSFLIALSRSLPARMEVVKLANGLNPNVSYNELLRLSADITKSFQYMPLPQSEKKPILHPSFQADFFDFLTRRFLLVIHRQVAIMGAYDPKYHFSRRVCLDSSLIMLSHFGVSTGRDGEDDHQRVPLATYCGGMFRNELLNSALSICVEMLMGKVDIETLGCSIHDQALSAMTDPSSRLPDDYLFIIIERARKMIEHWILEGHGLYSKMYMCLCTAFNSVKARYANEDPQTAVSTAICENVGNFKMRLLQRTPGIQMFDGTVAPKDTPESNVSMVENTDNCNDLPTRGCFAQSSFPDEMMRGDSEWDSNFDSWDIDWDL